MTKSELLQTAKPILFKAEMVRAILNGRKTVTRRVVKPQPTCGHGCTSELDFVYDNIAQDIYCKICGYPADLNKQIKAPYKPGDILYVRETWCAVTEFRFHKSNVPKFIYGYKADGTSRLNNGVTDIPITGWHPSIHMPKEAARIFLCVTNVRVERLQDIKDGDIWREGVKYREEQSTLRELFDSFSSLWDSTIPKKNLAIYGWDANPWVWVIEFKRIEVAE